MAVPSHPFQQRVGAPQSRVVQILHAEDDALVAAAVRDLLGGEGWRVTTCADGRAALREVDGPEHYDLLIVDGQLPGADGLELIRRARGLPHRRQLPVIMLTAGDAEREARRAGASAFLRKPEDVHALAETVARLLAREPKRFRAGGGGLRAGGLEG